MFTEAQSSNEVVSEVSSNSFEASLANSLLSTPLDTTQATRKSS